jgi:hypothetical protein
VTPDPIPEDTINRREAIRRVGAIFGGTAMVGGSALWTACGRADEQARLEAAQQGIGSFTPAEIAYLDEIAETILPETGTPGAKAAKVGPFIALMVTDTYEEDDQAVFRAGMLRLDEACQRMHQKTFMEATPQQRLALLEAVDRETKDYMDRRDAARRRREHKDPGERKADAVLPDQRKENAVTADANSAAAITADSPSHYFRMMKELTLLGYFTSEIGYTKAMRYVEAPGRFDPCVPYAPGEVSWAPHA